MKQIKRSLIFISLITAASSAIAAPVFQGRIQLGVQDYEFELANPRVLSPDLITTFEISGLTPSKPLTEGDFEAVVSFDAGYLVPNPEVLQERNLQNVDQLRASQTASDTLPMLGLGGTMILESGVFLDAYYQLNLSGEQAALSDTNGQDRFAYNDISDIEIDRQDMAFSIGKSFGAFTLSAGYKSGETDFEQTLTQDFRASTNPPGLTDVNGSVQSGLKLDGPFIGVAYSLPVKDSMLTFNLAFADLDADYSVSFNGDGIGNGPTVVRADLSGGASGATYGIKWSGDFTDKWSYTLGADYYSYDFDVSADVTLDRSRDVQTKLRGGHRAPLIANVTEKLSALRLDFKYTF